MKNIKYIFIYMCKMAYSGMKTLPMLGCCASSGPSETAPFTDSLIMSVKTSSFYKHVSTQ